MMMTIVNTSMAMISTQTMPMKNMTEVSILTYGSVLQTTDDVRSVSPPVTENKESRVRGCKKYAGQNILLLEYVL